MRFRDVLRMALGNLWRRKLRSILTILGVLIGVTSIVVMVSLGVGLHEQTMQSMDASDALTRIDVNENYYAGGGGYMDPSQPSEDQVRLTAETIEELAMIPGVKAVYPMLNVSLQAKSGAYEAWIQLMGVPEGYILEKEPQVGEGRMIDFDSTALELFAGSDIPTQFYNPNGGMMDSYDETPVDLLHDTVFGVFEDNYAGGGDESSTPPKKEILNFVGVGARDEDNPYVYDEMSYQVVCNLEALEQHLQRIYRGKALPGQPANKNGKPIGPLSYSQAVVRLNSLDDADSVLEQIQTMGLQGHSATEFIQTAKEQATRVQILFGGIGGVSLFVAAIGIMNTMMMSIYERTKEIGIFKVLGCDISRIRDLFLCEAALIGLIGGVLGVALSYAISHLINKLTSGGEFMMQAKISVIPAWLVGLALLFGILVGALSGLIPAHRAMKLSPLQALSNE